MINLLFCILQPVPACKFYLVVTAFFVIDVIIIASWFTFDPIQRVEQRFPLQVSTKTSIFIGHAFLESFLSVPGKFR